MAQGSALIVHLTDVFAPRVGGIEVLVESLARAQTAVGEEVHVITGTVGGSDSELPFRVHRARRMTDVRGILRRLRPSVVHIHVSVASPLAVYSAHHALRLCIPLVVTVHSMWDPPVRACYSLLGRLAGWHDGMVFTAVSTVVADQVGRALSSTPVVVPNAVSTDLWEAPYTSGAGLHVVSVGRLVTRRQPLKLLEVLRLAQDRLAGEVRVRATIVGSGPRRGAMLRYLRRHGMAEWVRLVGSQDHRAVREILASADVYLNVTRREAFGLATLEARTAGVPVIARSGTGVADFVEDGREGLLGRSTEDLVTALVSLGRRRTLRDRISAHNRAVPPAEFSWPVVLDRLRTCYDDAARRVTAPANGKDALG